MSASMSKNEVINFIRTPAKLITLEQKLSITNALNNELMTLLASHFPALSETLTLLKQQHAQATSNIDGYESELLLLGHGPRGVERSLNLTNQPDYIAFQKELPQPAKRPLVYDELLTKLESYLSVDTTDRRTWVIPEESMYGQQVRDGTNLIHNNLLEEKDGIYVIREKGEVIGYSFKLKLADGFLIFSPQVGPSLVTYSNIEQRWIQHRSWNFVDGPKALEEIDHFFSLTNVHDITISETRRLYGALSKLSGPELEAFSEVIVQWTAEDFTLKMNELFQLKMTKNGAFTIINIRDDIRWTDLTFFTRRQIFQSVLAPFKNHLTELESLCKAAPRLKLNGIKVDNRPTPVKKVSKKKTKGNGKRK
jgi:hypothetical protein